MRPTRSGARRHVCGIGMTALVTALGALLFLVTAVPAGAEGADKHYCDGCTPPLVYQGGPVLDTDGATGLTVTPIYWAPSGTPYQIPADYESIIDGYVANIAAASGQTTNVYSVDTEYYQVTEGATQYVNDDLKAGKAIIDTDAYPANGCKSIGGSTACITDQQIRDELTTLAQKQGLVTDVDHFYPVFLAAQGRDPRPRWVPTQSRATAATTAPSVRAPPTSTTPIYPTSLTHAPRAKRPTATPRLTAR